MKIHYIIDDSAARLPLSIRSAEGVLDRAADLRNAPSIHLVELTTQHMQGTGATLLDELTSYFDNGHPSEHDPYALATCYELRDQLEDLLRDLRDLELVSLHEVAALFPASFADEPHFMLALTAVGYPAFGYVRTYKDSEGGEYHGMVVNLAQARPHLEQRLGQFSLSLLTHVIRHGFFNHQGFHLAYDQYCDAIQRSPDTPLDLLKDALLSRGIAWYLSYRHDLAFYDRALGLDPANLDEHVAQWNALVETARDTGLGDESFAGWLRTQDACQSRDMICIDLVGYFAARALAADQGAPALRAAVAQGGDHFIDLYNALDHHPLAR
jgi:hypothetical protein